MQSRVKPEVRGGDPPSYIHFISVSFFLYNFLFAFLWTPLLILFCDITNLRFLFNWTPDPDVKVHYIW